MDARKQIIRLESLIDWIKKDDREIYHLRQKVKRLQDALCVFTDEEFRERNRDLFHLPEERHSQAIGDYEV